MCNVLGKTWLCLFLMLIAISIFSAKAEMNFDYKVSDEGYALIEYVITDEGYARIKGCISTDPNREELILPSMVDGYTVIALDSLQGDGDPLPYKRLVIPDSYTEITQNGFYGAWYLEAVSLPASLEKIEGNLFFAEDYSMMAQLKEIQISPRNKAFKVEDGCLIDVAEQKLIAATNRDHFELPEVRIIGEAAFYENQQIKRIRIPDTVELIEEYAFVGCENLQNVVFSKNLKQINAMAFGRCTSLMEVSIPETVLRIRSSAFASCTALKSVTLPEGLEEIDWYLFDGCSALTTIHLPENVQRILIGAFQDCTSLQEIWIPETVTEIDSIAFLHCDQLTARVYPSSYAEEYCREKGIKYEYR